MRGSDWGIHRSKISGLGLALLIFIPRLLNLDRFLTADEPLFLEHARQFAAALSGGDLGQTLGLGYPGVTVAWLAAPVVELAQTELGAYTAGRIVVALGSGVLLLVIYRLACLLLGQGPAWLGVGLLALDPYTLAYSRLLHIAPFLAFFMTLAGLSFLLWLQETRLRWLLLTALFTGLALLTKSTALLLGPMLVVITLGWAAVTGRWREGRWWVVQAAALVGISLGTILLFFLLWPAMWSQPGQTVALTLGKLFTDQEAGTGNLGFFWWGRFTQDPGPAFYPVAFALKATPWLLGGMLLSLGLLLPSRFFRSSSLFTPIPALFRRQGVILWLLALTYLVFMTIASKKSIRYMLPAFPTFYLLAGWGIYEIWNRWQAGKVWKRSLFVLLLLGSFLLALFYHPYYFTYYNPLLLGWRWAPQVMLVGWGEGLDQAARYLNQQPGESVAAWYEWLFPLFYRGQVEPAVPRENLITADHTVLYINQVQRDIPDPNIIHYFQTRRRPEYTVRLAGIEYAWVYPGPLAGFDREPAPQYPVGGDFGGEARLLGYDLHPQPRSGQPLIVTLFWRVLNSPPSERFVYLRLIDARGRVWARADGPPLMGLWPVDRWQPDMLLEDAQQIPIPPGTPPGTYRLEVGLYDPVSGQPLPASGQPPGQGGGLLLDEVTVVWQPLAVPPDLPNRVDIPLAPAVHLVGTGSLPPTATSGDVLPVPLAWRESSSLFRAGDSSEALTVVFEWRPTLPPSTGGLRGDAFPEAVQQVDPLPVPVPEWGRGAVLRSQHELVVPPTLPDGRYEVGVGLAVTGQPPGEVFPLGAVTVTNPPRRFDLPPDRLIPTGPAQLEPDIHLAGYSLDRSGDALTLRLYWQTASPISTRYKVFAQLLAAGTVLSQSDRFPAEGQRPTTGWLPGEIITDTHILSLPPDISPGAYQVIVGLYDPWTGQRLPVLDPQGAAAGDAILVTEIPFPLDP